MADARQAGWPYRAAELRRTFVPEEIARQGGEILLRSINNGRLVAFVGSGVSIEVGRPSWRLMAEEIVKQAQDAAATAAPDRTMQELRGALSTVYESAGKNPLIYLQLCDELFRLRQARAPAGPGQTPRRVQDLIKAMFSPKPGERHEVAPEVDWPALRDVPGGGPLEVAFDKWRAAKAGLVDGTTIRHLARTLGVRRFATTNYDTQIEAELGRMGWQARSRDADDDDRQSPVLSVGAWHRSASLTPSELGHAFTFAAQGRRRHASVLHLHGSHEDEDAIVATESDYQRHYLRNSPRRDLLDAAIALLFGANPVLYVGSGLTEDDVMRPLRQILSSAGQQDDALGVALLPASDDRRALDQRSIELFARHAIHTIHYDLPGAAPGGPPRLHLLRQRIEALRAAFETGAASALRELRFLQDLAASGNDDDTRLINHALGLLDALAAVARAQGDPLPERALRGLQRLIEAAEASITSSCLHLQLIAIDHGREAWASDLIEPFHALHRPLATVRATVDDPYRHVGVMTTAKDATHAPASARWQDLFVSLVAHPAFTRSRGRRIVLIPTPRGSGKGSMFDELSDHAEIRRSLCSALSGPDREERCVFALFSLMFLVDITDVIQAVDQLVGRAVDPQAEEAAAAGDNGRLQRNVLGQLERSLTRLTRQAVDKPWTCGRLMLVISNAGGLFDRDGEPKNGQVMRVLNLLMSRRFAKAPIDFVIFCDDRHVPKWFRQGGGAAADAAKAAPSLILRLPDQAEAQARLRLLGIGSLNLASETTHVFVPARCKARELASHFEALRALAAVDADSDENSPFRKIYLALGRNRIAMTLVLAQAAAIVRAAAANEGARAFENYANRVSSRLATQIHEAFPDAAIQFVLDEWGAMHRRGAAVQAWKAGLETICPASFAGRPDLAGPSWELMLELLWHLAVISHPVEFAVLAGCPGVVCQPALSGLDAEASRAVVRFALEVCVERRLAFRIRPRQGWFHADDSPGGQVDPGTDDGIRYTVHRAVQRHFVRTMGGRNVDSTEWDQFTTSLYASQRDELPSISARAHHRLTGLVDGLIGFAGPAGDGETASAADPRAVWIEAARLRAAYFVARSSYSLGVLSHIARLVDEDDTPYASGLMEEYRRRVRWITHRARSLEQRAGGGDERLRRAARPFLAGEVVWLYAECGALSLTQGKMEDADTLLQLALRAVRRIEADEQGSMHVRILLHLAMTHIERGRPGEARGLLEPIAHRVDGHRVPPLLAEFYLGLIDHLGGDYGRAKTRYDNARKGLAALGRNRAEALVTKHLADLEFATSTGDRGHAMGLVREAMSVAQRGGHEDVRMLAMLTHVRLRHAAHQGAGPDDDYALLDTVQQYARRMGMPRIACITHELRARLLLAQGETRMSMQEATASLRVAAMYDLKLMKAKALLTLAEICWRRKERKLAADLVREGGELANATEYFSCVRGFRALEVVISSDGP